MNKSLIVGLGIGLVVIIMSVFMITKYNTFVNLEEQLDAKHKDTQNVYAKITNDMKAQGSIVAKYSDDVIKAINAAVGGRYGEGGAKGAMLWLKEQNPTMKSEVYTKLSNVVSASYAQFQDAQTEKLEIVRVYKSQLRIFPGNIVGSMFGFPTKDLSKIGEIVTNVATEKAFETGKAEAVPLF